MANVLFVQPNAGWQWDALAEACALNKVVLYHAHTCGEAEEIIGRLCPAVVVCALNFPDGDWRRILQLAQEASMPCSVIVVSQHEDVPLYLTAMESGAYDFATLQASKTELSWIIRCAIGNSENRREAKRVAATSVFPQRSLKGMLL
jgi:DNA-binding NtrC family response regulator